MIRTLLAPYMGWVVAAAVVGAVGMIWFYGKMQYKEGVRDTTAAFIAADNEGARDVHDTARETLSSIGDDFDPDSLLRDTGGLRD